MWEARVSKHRPGEQWALRHRWLRLQEKGTLGNLGLSLNRDSTDLEEVSVLLGVPQTFMCIRPSQTSHVNSVQSFLWHSVTDTLKLIFIYYIPWLLENQEYPFSSEMMVIRTVALFFF